MYGLENKLFEQLEKLKQQYGLKGIKAEFEAEGSSFRDAVKLRRLTSRIGVKLFLKIGGVEAVTDIKNSVDIGVDGLIAPMVESKFGVRKFVQASKNIYKKTKLQLILNIETKSAVNQIDEILGYAKDKIDGITIGRTDLSESYFDENIHPDTNFILNILENVGRKIKHYNLQACIGGGISARSLEIFRKHKKILRLFDKIETRKVILPAQIILNNPNALRAALKFEELYILSKKEINDLFIEAEIARLTQLERRL
ncbi:MAG: aldolase/citrate lyase family protein [Candidatus Omnitrophica bacterium]|nr:aldolase/citrate lyase family protein [Candidatus Omnitrophota bacterium]MDD5591861.1 aldolase/citrate lyase family protein [Candidatus Omnitrophota bacterium]